MKKMNDLPAGAKALIPRGSSVLCAVSGGADSMCMLYLLYTGREELGIRVCAAHYEHGIRGEESLRDCEFVRQFCEERNIEFVCAHGDVPAYAEAHGMSTEEAARELRYAFLEKAASELGCDLIATAHNADDNVETMLFNLTRGAGAEGLCGIPEKRGNIIRPLLRLSRAGILGILEEAGIGHVEDSTNLSNDYTRNKIRHTVVPVLKSVNPALCASAAGAAELIRRDDDCLCAMAEEYLKNNPPENGLPLDSFNALHPAVSSRVVRLCAGHGLSREHVRAVLETAKSGSSRCDIRGMRVSAERGRLYFGRNDSETIPERILAIGTVTDIPEAGLKISCGFELPQSEINSKFTICRLKYENIYGEITVSSRRPGDSMRPAGRKCTKTLKSMFLEKKLTVREKNLTPVIRDERGILCIPGLAVDERCAAADARKILIIAVEKYREI